MRQRARLAAALVLASTTALAPGVGCGGAGTAEPVYPSRPPATPGEPITDPTPARVVLHATVTGPALASALEGNVPISGESTVPVLGSDRKLIWRRNPMRLRFQQGRVGIDLHIDASLDMPIGSVDLPLDFRILAEPVVSSTYVAKLQSLDVQVSSDARLVRVADAASDALTKVKATVESKLRDFSYDLSPTLGEAYARIARPIELPLGDASGCAQLAVLGVEAAPTVLADGIEKDIAFVVAPSVTIPCAPQETAPRLPPLANVAALPTGPFAVTVPIAAEYSELAKAMSLAFTDGKLFFSKEYPKLYLEKPEVYASKDRLAVKLHLRGPVSKYGIDTTLDGDLYLMGHPAVEDNELRIPDLEPTIETSDFLLKLKASLGADEIRDEARAALRLDIGERLKAVKRKLSTDLSFGNGQGCLRADTHKIEVSSIHVHGAYLRIYVTANASASVYMPCP